MDFNNIDLQEMLALKEEISRKIEFCLSPGPRITGLTLANRKQPSNGKPRAKINEFKHLISSDLLGVLYNPDIKLIIILFLKSKNARGTIPNTINK
jgi:hypothetical protein